MAITGQDGLLLAVNSAQELAINKASLAGQIAGAFTSLWRATGYPAQAAIPGAAAVCDSTLLGALILPSKAGGQNRVLAGLDLACATAGQLVTIEDRLAHMGGLNGTVITAQSVAVDVSVSTSNMVTRKGAADFSEVRWWLEWYTTTGATGVNATCDVTFGDATTGQIVVVIPASTAASRKIEIVPTNGKWVKSIQQVTLSATTGTAGSFGVTASRTLGRIPALQANASPTSDWASLKAREIADQACVQLGMNTTSVNTGTVIGAAYMAIG